MLSASVGYKRSLNVIQNGYKRRDWVAKDDFETTLCTSKQQELLRFKMRMSVRV